MNPEIFREYDIRGIADSDIPSSDAQLIGKAYGTIIHNNGGSRVIVGRDNRVSGPRILKALMDGILSTGINITFIGEVSTPLLYYAVSKLECEGGISVTASHNPPEFNGFKVLVGKSAIYGEAIQQIRKVAEKGEFAKGKGAMQSKDLEEQYLNEIASLVHFTSPQKKLKVVIDAGNAMASDLAPRLLKKIGLEPICLFCEKDPSFPNHMPDPVDEKNVKDLQKTVLSEKADLGVAFDGDSDRVGVVDDKGRLIYGDRLLAILAQDALKRNPGGKVIFEVKCSQALPEWVEKHGGKPIMWKTGHSLIKAKMKEENALIAGEMSGHMFFTEKWYGFDDALLAAAKIIEIAANSQKKLSELVDAIPSYHSSPEIRIDCPDNKKAGVVAKISKKYKKLFPNSITIDGIRIIFPRQDGWALVRQSNTQPKLILRFEAKNAQGLKKLEEKILPEVRSLISE
ncbi:MAG: phosphomannomutase/phosphoglucomutase [archaeon]|nr:phosphomannomutase/phosphoglucomutase [archaeon]